MTWSVCVCAETDLKYVCSNWTLNVCAGTVLEMSALKLHLIYVCAESVIEICVVKLYFKGDTS